MEVIREAKNYMLIRLALYGFLSLMLIGIPFLIKALLEYFSNKLRIEKHSIILEKGIISKSTIDIPYNKINSIQVRQGIIGRMLHYGDVVILTGNDIAGQVFEGIDNPQQIKMRIQELMK